MGRSQRVKGRLGQSQASKILASMGWTVDPITAGVRREDLIATDTNDRRWSVEVKKQKTINLAAFLKQAREQSKERRLPWMLMIHLHGTRVWLVIQKGGEFFLCSEGVKPEVQ